MPLEIGHAGYEVAVAVMLERADVATRTIALGRACRAGDDVEELLHPEVGREAAFGHT